MLKICLGFVILRRLDFQNNFLIISEFFFILYLLKEDTSAFYDLEHSRGQLNIPSIARKYSVIDSKLEKFLCFVQKFLFLTFSKENVLYMIILNVFLFKPVKKYSIGVNDKCKACRKSPFSKKTVVK